MIFLYFHCNFVMQSQEYPKTLSDSWPRSGRIFVKRLQQMFHQINCHFYSTSFFFTYEQLNSQILQSSLISALVRNIDNHLSLFLLFSIFKLILFLIYILIYIYKIWNTFIFIIFWTRTLTTKPRTVLPTFLSISSKYFFRVNISS